MQYAREFMHKHAAPALSSSARRDALRRILRAQPARRQADLVRELQAQGFEVTQSSVSRDLRELGAARVNDRYVLAEEGILAPTQVAVLAGFVREVLMAGPNLTVVKTATGAAQSVALAIDRDRWSDVVGTISGDDTIFIASADGDSQRRIVERLRTTFNV